MWAERSLLGTLALSLLLGVGCATTRGGTTTAAAAEPTPPSGAPDCTRSVAGDTETARARFEAGRLDEALLYIRGLDGCPGALRSAPYLQLAMDVYEDKGWLNEAWAVARLLDDLGTFDSDEELAARTEDRRQRFSETYVLLTTRSDRRSPPAVQYTGPVQDDATTAQLQAISEGRGVSLSGGRLGYWLYPGRYEIDGAAQALRPGQRLDLDDE